MLNYNSTGLHRQGKNPMRIGEVRGNVWNFILVRFPFKALDYKIEIRSWGRKRGMGPVSKAGGGAALGDRSDWECRLHGTLKNNPPKWMGFNLEGCKVLPRRFVWDSISLNIQLGHILPSAWENVGVKNNISYCLSQ
ncbi:hypothetical protein AVEN_129649-1 [Araneus ventricosus]|uniref:Uncharacterized protein n=1 Tax=Araneus ventricosus TaxID=182803 RepID=A0A4Y2QYI3_ARAVE|nr:hypothetical protein AVEN_129649-1 [Araneus ventricosus]